MATGESLSQTLTFDLVENSEGQFCNKEVLVRLIHHWEARNHKKGNILMGIELLLLDSKLNAVKAFISANRTFRYEQNLKPNAVYKMANFMIIPSKKSFSVSDYKYAICFTDKTTLVFVLNVNQTIPEQKFRLRNFKDFLEIADTGTHLFDAIGELRRVDGDNLQSSNTTNAASQVQAKESDRVFLHLLLKDGETMHIYLWGNIAANFRSRWNGEGVKPRVLLITTVYPKTLATVVTLSSTSSSRLFFDKDLDETKELLARLIETGQSLPTVTNASSAVTKIETVTIKEITQFVQNQTAQVANCICVATIVDILAPHGWHYISCSFCTTKLRQSQSSLYCNSCKKDNNVGLIRYRFEIKVRDKNDDTTTFVVFDREGINFVGKRAGDVLNDSKQVVEEDHEQINSKTPECLKHIIGQTCKFQIKVTSYNFQAYRQTFSVSRIIRDNIGNDPQQSEPELPTKDTEPRDDYTSATSPADVKNKRLRIGN